MGAPRRLLIGTTLTEQITTSFFPHLTALHDAGWEIHLVCAPGEWPKGPPPAAAAVIEHRIPMVKPISPVADARALRQWVALVRRVRPDVVIGASPKGGLLAMLAARAAGVPRRIFVHRGARWETLTGPSRRLTVAAEKVTIRAATEVVAVSDSLADLVQAEGITRRRATVLCGGGDQGVDLDRFRPVGAGAGDDQGGAPPDVAGSGAAAGAASATTGAGGGSAPPFPVLGYVGRLAADKGLDVVLDALDAVRLDYSAARLVVIGEVDDADPPSADVLGRLDSDPGVTTMGWVPDVAEPMRSFDVLVFPSLREGLPNAVIEAAASGVPTVGWDVTGVRDAIDDGVTGRVVWPVRDAAGFRRAVLEVLRPGRGAHGAACRGWSHRFDQCALTDAWVALLDGPSYGPPT